MKSLYGNNSGKLLRELPRCRELVLLDEDATWLRRSVSIVFVTASHTMLLAVSRTWHSHVLATCCSSGVEEMTVDLLDPEPCPPQFRAIQPLCLSLGDLREKFVGTLTGEGFSLSDFN